MVDMHRPAMLCCAVRVVVSCFRLLLIGAIPERLHNIAKQDRLHIYEKARTIVCRPPLDGFLAILVFNRLGCGAL